MTPSNTVKTVWYNWTGFVTVIDELMTALTVLS